MSSKIEIANMALRRIGEQPIGSFTEESEAAGVMSDIYDIALAEELRNWSWPFATTTVSLAEVSGETPPDWGYVFQLPSDYLQVVKLIDPNSGTTVTEWAFDQWKYFTARNVEWKIRESKLYINLSAITLEYVYLQTDTEKFDPSFTHAFSRRLAMEAAPAITEREDVAQAVAREYFAAITRARGAAGVESRQSLDISRDYIKAR